MKAAYEAPRFQEAGASLAAFGRDDVRFAWNWHYHLAFELTWIREGRGRRLVGDRADDYGRDDLILLGASLPHTWASAEGVVNNSALVVQFQAEAFPEGLLRLPEFAAVNELLGRAARGVHFRMFDPTLKENLLALPREKGLMGWVRLLGILQTLAREREADPLASEGYRHHRSQRLNTRLERVTDFIEKNCREPLPLSEGAKLCGLTPSAFSRFFRQMTGQTFVSFRNGCRIREAGRLLIETEAPVTQVALECGFENLANFNRRFREIEGTTPSRYRRVRMRPNAERGGGNAEWKSGGAERKRTG